MGGFYTTHEAARLLGVSLPTVVNWIKARRIKAHRTPGGHRRIARTELAEFMLRHGMPVPRELDDAVAVRRKALVIADGGPIREGLVRQLAQSGWAVEQSSPGFTAGVTAARFQPDVFVVQASGAGGDETIQGIRSDLELADIPIVGLATDAEAGERLLAEGCAEVLRRPLADGALAAAATRVVGAPPPKGSRPPARQAPARPPRGRARD
jgi:excisionase family DNA binding protein